MDSTEDAASTLSLHKRVASSRPRTRVIVKRHAAILAVLGIDQFRGAWRFAGGSLVKRHGDLREIRRITIDDCRGPDGRPLTLFLKRNYKTHSRYAYSLVTSARRRSIAEAEWRNMLRLQATGVRVCSPVAVGSAFGLLGERGSYLITEAAPGDPLDEIAEQPIDPRRRRRIGAAVAKMFRDMHAGGVCVPGAYARHLFVYEDPTSDVVQVTQIDIDRLRRPRRDRSGCARDLASLHISIPQRLASGRERLRFLRCYHGGGRIDRRFLAMIERMFQAHRLRKPKLAAAFDRLA